MSTTSSPWGFAKPCDMAKFVLEENMLRLFVLAVYLMPEKCLEHSRHSINIDWMNGFLPHKDCNLYNCGGHNKLSTQPFVKYQGSYLYALLIYHRLDFHFANLFISKTCFKYSIIQRFLTCTIIQLWYNPRFSVLVYTFRPSDAS